MPGAVIDADSPVMEPAIPKGFLAAPPSRATECWRTDVTQVGLADGSAIGYRAHQLEQQPLSTMTAASVSDVSRHNRERVTVPELVTLTWAGAGERVTGIEPALSAWESARG